VAPAPCAGSDRSETAGKAAVILIQDTLLTGAIWPIRIVPLRTATMAAVDPDELPKKKITHEMGQDLSLLSLGELGERIGLLREEIARLEAEMARKRASKSAADTVFKR
jgi:uncharacterized small protein (DUF1192 family)